MAKPVIWTVDDDPDVLRAVERDLRRQYGDRYKVISADSGASALEAVKQFAGPDYAVAVFEPEAKLLLSRIEPTAAHYEVRVSTV